MLKKSSRLGRLARLLFIGVPFYIRVQKPITKILGPKFKRSLKKIEIDITYRCNLKCANCNRSCTQAPTPEQMTVEQINKFIQESVTKNIRWVQITVLGGEPTLHPELLKILKSLLDYKTNHSPKTTLQLVTNGFGKHAKKVLKDIPKEIEVRNTSKDTLEPLFYPFNLAPKDSPFYIFADYRNGCATMRDCGIGLSPYGYYPCAVAAGIDRIFGFNVGRKQLPKPSDDMNDQLNLLCKLCGHFRSGKARYTRKGLMSPSWQEAYTKYQKNRPKMDYY